MMRFQARCHRGQFTPVLLTAIQCGLLPIARGGGALTDIPGLFERTDAQEEALGFDKCMNGGALFFLGRPPLAVSAGH